MRTPAVLYEVHDGVATLTLNRPNTRNALSSDIVNGLLDSLDRVEDDPGVRAVVLTGAGPAFCAGGDLGALRRGFAPGEGRRYVLGVSRLIVRLMELEQPVISAVNGAAFGAGFNLALAADLVIAADNARFSQSYVSVGLVPDLGGFFFLSRIVGLHKAKELVLTGRILSAAEAEAWGIVNRVVPTTDLVSTAVAIAGELARGPSLAMRLAKAQLNQAVGRSLQELLDLEANLQDICFQSEDFREGIAAFFEKRRPRFAQRGGS